MIVNTVMRKVGSHSFNCIPPPYLQKLLITNGIILKQRRSVLKSLCPFCPSAGCIFSIYRKYRCASFYIEVVFYCQYFFPGQFPKMID